nr:MAG TPA: hypothetical protein [Caudoviricetes sp.]
MKLRNFLVSPLRHLLVYNPLQVIPFTVQSLISLYIMLIL